MIIITISHDYGDVVYFITTSQKLYKAENVLSDIYDILTTKAVTKHQDDYLMAGVVINVWRYHLSDIDGYLILDNIKNKEVINIT